MGTYTTLFIKITTNVSSGGQQTRSSPSSSVLVEELTNPHRKDIILKISFDKP